MPIDVASQCLVTILRWFGLKYLRKAKPKKNANSCATKKLSFWKRRIAYFLDTRVALLGEDTLHNAHKKIIENLKSCNFWWDNDNSTQDKQNAAKESSETLTCYLLKSQHIVVVKLHELTVYFSELRRFKSEKVENDQAFLQPPTSQRLWRYEMKTNGWLGLLKNA